MHQIPTPPRSFFFATIAAALLLTPAAFGQTAVSFDKTFAPNIVGPGSTSTLTFTILNNTGLVVQNLAFTDNLPAGLVIAGAPNASTNCPGFPALSAPAGGTAITFSSPGIGAGGSCSIKVNVTGSTTPGTYTNSVSLTFSGGSDAASADLTVADNRPGFSKSFSPASVSLGGRSTLTFTIDNPANAGVRANLAFADNLPPGMTIASPANRVNGCGGTFSAPAGGSAISLSSSSAITIGAGSCTLRVDVIGSFTGALGNNSGELTSTNQFGSDSLSSGKASAALTVNAVTGNLSLEKSFTDDPVAPGGTVTLAFTIRNLSRGNTATNIGFTDDLDAALSGLEAIGLPAAACGGTLGGTGLLTFAGGSLAPEGICTFTVTLQVPAGATPGTYANTTSSITADLGGSPAAGDPATDILVVEAAPVLTKEFLEVGTLTPDPVISAGSDVVLRFTATNTSMTSGATDVAFTDELTTFLPFPISAVLPGPDPCGTGSSISLVSLGVGGQGLSLTAGDLAPSASCTFDVTLTVPADVAPGTYVNTTSEITATVGGEALTGNPASDTLDVIAAPELIKTFLDDPVAPGGTVRLELTLVHDENSPGDATDIAFTDDLTAALAGLEATGLPANDVCGTGSQISGTTNLSFTGGTLAPGDSCTFVVTLQVPSTAPAGAHLNVTSSVTATVLGQTTTNDPATDNLVIEGLVLSKEFTNDPVIAGGTVNLSFTITNDSPSDATAITFQDDLSDVLAGLVATGLPISACGGTVSGTGNISFSGGSLASGTSCTFAVTLDVPAGAAPGTYVNSTNTFLATIEGGTVAFDNALDDLVISEFLAFTKEFTNDPVLPGGTVNLRFTLSNLVAGQDMTNLAFNDDLNAVIGGMVATGLPLTDPCGVGSQLAGTSVLSFTGGSLLGGTSCFFDVTLSVPSVTGAGTVALNTTSEVTGLLDGLAFIGAAASDELQVESLTFSKAFGGVATAGGTVSLSFTIRNVSTTESVGDLSFSDDLAAVLPGLVATGLPAADVCGAGSQISGTSFLTLTGGSLLPGGSCTIVVTLQVPAGTAAGSYLNTSSQLRRDGGTPAARQARATLTVATSADLSITKTDAPDPVTAGGVLVYTVTVANAGPSDAQNVVVTDTLPAGVAFPSTAGCAGDPNGVPSCSLGTITAGGSALYTIMVTVDAGASGPLTNTAVATSSTADPDPANNTASEDTAVGVADDDGDGVPNGLDACPGTVIDPTDGEPNVPEIQLGTNRWALIDGDHIFDTKLPNGNGPREAFTTERTGGCSCEQIIDELGLGEGHRKFGCSIGVMREWVHIIDLTFFSPFASGFESGDLSPWSTSTPR